MAFQIFSTDLPFYIPDLTPSTITTSRTPSPDDSRSSTKYYAGLNFTSTCPNYRGSSSFSDDTPVVANVGSNFEAGRRSRMGYNEITYPQDPSSPHSNATLEVGNTQLMSKSFPKESELAAPASGPYPYTMNEFFKSRGLRWTCPCCFEAEDWEELRSFSSWHEEEYKKRPRKVEDEEETNV